MRQKLLWIGLFCLLFSACSSVPSGDVDVSNFAVLEERIPADSIHVFGVALGDSVDDVNQLHGSPIETNLRDGILRTSTYSLTRLGFHNITYVFLHGSVNGIFVDSSVRKYLHNRDIFAMNTQEIQSMLGEPSEEFELGDTYSFSYDALGYEFQMKNDELSRVYFRSPNLFPKDPDCPQVNTPATDGLSCINYVSPCAVPENWTIVESC